MVHCTLSLCTCSHITPRKGINDDNRGKKHALSKLIHAATSEYVWLHDDDVVLPPILQAQGAGLTTQWSYSKAVLQQSGLVILPLAIFIGKITDSGVRGDTGVDDAYGEAG